MAMKKLKSIVTSFIFIVLPMMIFAQDAVKKIDVIPIQTSARCDECKQRIESAVHKVKGVKKANLNLEDQKIMVEYKTRKTTPEAIKNAIAKSGYDADEVKADIAAYTELPMCCKKDAEKH